MKTHELKIKPEYFRDVVRGIKTFEVRQNDRNFGVDAKWLKQLTSMIISHYRFLKITVTLMGKMTAKTVRSTPYANVWAKFLQTGI